MQSQNYLGIYLSKDTATVLCLGLQGHDKNVLGCFSVSAEKTEGQSSPDLLELAGLIARGCAERELQFSEVAVALDCAMFMQHDVHSEFDDPKQIAATIKFDTEEALGTDITDVATAFKIASTDQTGSELAVFTAQRKILSEIILSLQSNNIDPVTVEPDVNCLSRFICQNVSLSEPQQGGTFFGIFSHHNGYLIVPGVPGSQKQSAVRTFLVGATQNRGELLERHLPIATTLLNAGKPINCIKVFDSAGSVNCQQLGEKLGVEADYVDFADSAGTSPQTLADCDDPVGFAIAYGAALAHLEKAQSINFRNDFMPYMGRKLRLQKAVKFLSISVTVLLLVLGLYLQLQLFQKNKPRSRLRDKFAKDYSAVMLGKKLPARSDPVKKLAGELRRIRSVKSGQLSATGEESVSAKLNLVLEAFNKCASQIDLNINSIIITTKTISIVGDTSGRKNTIKLRQAIEKAGLKILKDNLELKGGRDNFRITVEPR